MKQPYFLGSKPYKRFIKGPCALVEEQPGGTFKVLSHGCFAGPNDVIDTKGIKHRKDVVVIPH